MAGTTTVTVRTPTRDRLIELGAARRLSARALTGSPVEQAGLRAIDQDRAALPARWGPPAAGT